MQISEQSPNASAAGIVTDTEKLSIEGEAATQDEVFYARLGEELIKRELPFLNDVLRQLITLTVSMLGGGVFFLTPENCVFGMRLTAMIIFFLALLCAFAGMLPRAGGFHLFAPYEIKTCVDEITSWKSTCIAGASVFLALGFFFAVVGVLTR